MRPKHFHWLFAALFVFDMSSVHAIDLIADVRHTVADDDAFFKYSHSDFLKTEARADGSVQNDLDFGASWEAKKFVEILDKSINVSDPEIRRQIAAEFAKFSDVCDLSKMTIYMSISTIGKLETKMANAADPRAISSFGITGCKRGYLQMQHLHEKMPAACNYTSEQHDGGGMDFSYFIQVTKECHLALQTQYEAHPEAIRTAADPTPPKVPSKGEAEVHIRIEPSGVVPGRFYLFNLFPNYDGAKISFKKARCSGYRLNEDFQLNFEMNGETSMAETGEPTCRGTSEFSNPPADRQWMLTLGRPLSKLIKDARSEAQYQSVTNSWEYTEQIPIRYTYPGRKEDEGAGTASVAITLREPYAGTISETGN